MMLVDDQPLAVGAESQADRIDRRQLTSFAKNERAEGSHRQAS
jgi:hypothetical protein